MYNMLKDGVLLADMRRGVRDMRIPMLCGRRSGIVVTKQLRNSLHYLIAVIDDYIADRNQCA